MLDRWYDFEKPATERALREWCADNLIEIVDWEDRGLGHDTRDHKEKVMAEIIAFAEGGYRFAKGVYPYSAGVAALPGFALERARFRAPVPVAEGFRAIAAHLEARGRPLAAFAACELRSPAPFTEQGFRAFNEVYVVTLEKWKLYDGKVNPVARSNVCPDIDPPPEPCFHAFSFTVADADAAPSFVIAGSAETREGSGSYSERTIRRGESSPEAMREKAHFVRIEPDDWDKFEKEFAASSEAS